MELYDFPHLSLGAEHRSAHLFQFPMGIRSFFTSFEVLQQEEGSNLLLFVASAYKYFKKGDDCFVIVYKLGISYKFLDQIQLKSRKSFITLLPNFVIKGEFYYILKLVNKRFDP